MQQCQQLNIGKQCKIQDIKELNAEAVSSLLTEIYS